MSRFSRGVFIVAPVFCLFFFFGNPILRQVALAQIAELSGSKVKVQSIDINLDGSVLIKNLVIAPQKARYDDTILIADTVEAKFSVPSLLLLRPRLREIAISSFVFKAQKNLDTLTWNIGAIKLNKPDTKIEDLPLIILEKGILQCYEVAGAKPRLAASLTLDARLAPAESPADGYAFDIKTAEISTGYARNSLKGVWKSGLLTITGRLSSTNIPRLNRCFAVDVLAAELNYDKDNNFSLTMNLKDVFMTTLRERIATLPEPLDFTEKIDAFGAVNRFLDRYQPAGRLEIELEASGNFSALSEVAAAGFVDCVDVSICKTSFPYEVNNIAGRIDFTRDGVILNNLTGRHGESALSFNGFSRNFGPVAEYDITIASDSLALDEDLYNALSEEHKKLWCDYSPRGLAAINYHIMRQPSSGKTTALQIEPLGVEAFCRFFQYPLKNLTGSILLDNHGAVFSHLMSAVNGQKIIINGEITTPAAGNSAYNIAVHAENVAIDSSLIAALPEKQKQFCEPLKIRGLADAEVTLRRNEYDAERPDFKAEVSVKKTLLKLEPFPMIFSDVSAKAVITPTTIDVENFSGNCGDGTVSLTAQIWPRQDRKLSYRLALDAKGAELNNDLFELLPSSLGSELRKLNPQGLVNYSANISNMENPEKPDYNIKIDCMGNSLSFQRFPYPLKDVSGSVKITNISDTTALELNNIRATIADSLHLLPDSSTLTLDGQVNIEKDSFRDGFFKVTASDICVDEKLKTALGSKMLQYCGAISPSGRIDLDMENISVVNTPDGIKHVTFDGEAKLKSCGIENSPGLSELNATVRMKGLYNTSAGLGDTSVALAAESLRINNKAVTGLSANIIYDAANRNWSSSNFVADCYDGKIAGKAMVRQTPDLPDEYMLQMTFDSIGMESFLNDSKQDRTRPDVNTSGKMDGSFELSGKIGDANDKLGRFRLLVTDMTVGKASPLAKLLDVLKLNEPKDYVFDRMAVDSYIKRDEMFFENIDISGDNVAFKGSGTMNLTDNNINLTFAARGRRLATEAPSILQSLSEGLGQAVVRMNVAGSLYEPQVNTKALPVIEDTLALIGTKPDIDDR